MGVFDEIVSGGPYAVYIAPYGTARPPIAAAVHRPWILLGVHGPASMTEEGIRFSQPQTLNKVFALGVTPAVKAYRIQEEFDITFSLHDLTVEAYNRAINGVDSAVIRSQPTASRVGWNEMPLMRRGHVAEFAALIRMDVSPYDASFRSQFELYRAYNSADQAITLDKGSNPATLNFTLSTLYSAIHDGTAVFQAQNRADL